MTTIQDQLISEGKGQKCLIQLYVTTMKFLL
jgi:hypothetical protein